MSGDPFRIFRSTPGKQGTLKALWPELYACLAGTDKPAAERVVPCVLGDCPVQSTRPRAVARLTKNGQPACATHVRELADRPGGWPLSREDESR